MRATFHVQDFIKSLKSTEDRMDAFGASAWRELVKEASDSRIEHNYQNKTGALSASMSWRTWQPHSFGYIGEIRTDAGYALWVDEPTQPHVITAKNSPNLYFYWPKIGGWCTAKSVNHPGTTGAKFTDFAVRFFEREVHQRISAAFDSAIMNQ